MKRWLLLCLTIFVGLTVNGQSKLQLLSPDKTIRVEIKTSGRLSYQYLWMTKKYWMNQTLI